MHVAELTRALRGRIPVEVRTFGTQREEAESWRVAGYPPDAGLAAADILRPVWDAFGRCLAMATDLTDADLVHCHTWYTHLGGLLIQRGRGIPLVVTVHSLEPLRPWKREQLGGGYDLSSWVERTALESADAVVAVSAGTRDDVLRNFDVDAERVTIIHNGIDADFFAPDAATDALERFGIDASIPSVLFVGRITRQKGIVHLLRAVRHLDPGIGIVLAAGQPDTPELAAEVEALVAEARASRASERDLDPRDAESIRDQAAVQPCGRVRVPIGLRTVRDHEPGGDGLRDTGRGECRRRDSRGGGRRRDRRARAGRAVAR